MPRRLPLLAFVASAVLACEATAIGFADPFDSDALAPPRPLLQRDAGSDRTAPPCQSVAAGTVYGLLEVVDTALCQNPATHEAWANARAQAALVGAARGAFLPGVDATLSVDRGRSNGQSSTQQSAGLTFSWLLFDFGARAANVDLARELLTAASATLDTTVQSVFLSALQSYYNVQAARAAVVATIESERASRESVTAANVRYTVGAGTPSERLQAQTALSQATLNRIRAENASQNAYGTLANVMGLDANVPLAIADTSDEVPDEAFERDVAALIDEARQSRPDLRAAEAQFRAAQSTVAATRASGRPTLSLGAGPNWIRDSGGGDSFTSHSNAIGLTLRLPIFTGFDTTYRVRSAEARAEAASAQREALRLQVALDVWIAYQTLTTSLQTIRTTADLLASAEQSERVALGRYKAGVGNILDVLNAQSALASARVERIQALLDWRVSRATLARAVGSLDARLLNPLARDLPR